MRKLRRNEDAVSPVIATLLVIAIAVAAAILVYVWSMGLIGTLQSGGGEQVTEQIIMDIYSWNASTGLMTMHLRNVGNTVVDVDKIYVETDTGIEDFDGPVVGVDGTLGIGEVEVFTPTVTAADTTNGVQYTIKIVSSSGGVFSFSAICGSAG
jgi:FlaG/FlaF family flagellin (archaellin)